MNIPKWINDLLFDKKYWVAKHLLFWIFIYADELLSFIGVTAPLELPTGRLLLILLIDMALVYSNIYWLLPNLFLKGKSMSYALFTLLSIVIVVVSNNILYDISWAHEDLLSIILSDVTVTTGLLFMAIAMKLINQMNKDSTKLLELREDKLQTELAYLKTQVNPHFLFNTLNNMYVMSKKKDEQVPETIMQLSELLRYQLYECNDDTVPIKNEIAYLKNYIELEQLRRQSLKVVFDIKVDNIHIPIRPLIFLPFIENAFKYSNSNSGTDSILINLESRDNILYFSCKLYNSR